MLKRNYIFKNYKYMQLIFKKIFFILKEKCFIHHIQSLQDIHWRIFSNDWLEKFQEYTLTIRWMIFKKLTGKFLITLRRELILNWFLLFELFSLIQRHLYSYLTYLLLFICNAMQSLRWNVIKSKQNYNQKYKGDGQSRD